MATPTFALAILWDGTALTASVPQLLEGLEGAFEPSAVSNLALTLSPSMACMHFTVDFSKYSRATMTQLESDTKKSGGRFIELLRIPEEKRDSFRAQFLMPPQGSPRACASFKECGRPLLDHLTKLRTEVPIVKPQPQARQAPSRRQTPRFNVHLQVEFATDADLVREHSSNISKGGVFVRTTQRPALNSELELRIKLPNGQVIQTAARVVHIVDQAEVGGVGLAFTRVDPQFTEALERYLRELQKN